jgi:hypothetical protein
MATNKNQHFVPRAHLKAFTIDGADAAINVFNIDRMRAIPSAPVKNQCSGNYFYGNDELLEAAIQRLEGDYAAAVRRVHAPGHRLAELDRTILRIFMLFQHMRTEAASKRSVEMMGGMERVLHAENSGLKPSIKQAVQLAMRMFADSMHLVEDLKLCLVRNRTPWPFVTSDDPAVMTNRWHFEEARAKYKTPGLMAAGLLFYLPLSPRVACIAYDGDVYSIPHENGWAEVRHERDVLAFNELQTLNAAANLYFRDWADRDWIARAVQPAVAGRELPRHRVTLAVFDKAVGDYERFTAIDPSELKEGDRPLVHSETLLRAPSSWPRQIRWHPKGFVFTNGTRSGFLREGQLQYRNHGGHWKQPARKQ